MSWLPKWLGLGPKEDTRLYLKLRLTRWRHLLLAERVCLDLLADLREKGKGEYIFDRQYLYATVGQIFQKAFQVAYDRGLLEKDEEAGMYLWLDRLKECATAYLQNWTPESDKDLPGPGSRNKLGALEGQPMTERGGTDGESRALLEEPGYQELKALLEEPEYRMLKGLLHILDPQGALRGSGPIMDKIEPGMTLRQGLYRAHDRVLARLISPQAWPQWIKEGSAYQIEIKGASPILAVDLGEKRPGVKSASGAGGAGDRGQSPAHPLSPFAESPGSFPWLPGTPPGERPSPVFLAFDVSTFFLMGSSPSGRVIVDAVQTSIRKLNHFFLHWEGRPDHPSGREAWTKGFHWDRQEDHTFFEVYEDQKSAEEIRNLLKKVGLTWGYQ